MKVSATANVSRAMWNTKILPHHQTRMAMVYVRQSTTQQMVRHQESTRLQYALREHALVLGWASDRVEVIDDDLGQSAASAEGRPGFQRLIAEVGLDHVGIILGIEMSRLARSCRDWHHLLEICALFKTLIGDPDGIYDPADYNDRLLLGLKGTMSEAELHILKRRMLEGKRSKARRGELGMAVPIGYVRHPSGEVVKEPDERVQLVVDTVFEQFQMRGTVTGVLLYLVEHDLQLPVRLRTGAAKGDLVWRRPNRQTLQNIMKNPIYGGAYVYGRRPTDPRRKKVGRPATGRTVANVGEWDVLIHDKIPAYISWEQYEANQAQLRANRNEAKGVCRRGPSLLSGLLRCGRCGRRMMSQYSGGYLRYGCTQEMATYGGKLCQSLAGRVLDRAVEKIVLEALEPAALDVSLEVAADVERQRSLEDRMWQQRLEQASYEADRALRQYNVVEPENRLVGRTMEQKLEEQLAVKQKLEEEYHRHRRHRPAVLSDEERDAIRRLAQDIPALWHTESTTVKERQQIIRQLIDAVEVLVLDDSEKVDVVVDWAGGHKTSIQIIRPVGRLDQLSYLDKLVKRVRELKKEGRSSVQIATVLNEEGWRPAKRCEKFNGPMVRQLMSRQGITSRRRSRTKPPVEPKLKKDEWTVRTLARELEMPQITLYSWIRKGWVKARKRRRPREHWVIRASKGEVKRLLSLKNASRYRWPRRNEVGNSPT